MKTVYQTIHELLENEPMARERRFKDSHLAALIAPKYAQGMFFPQDKLVEFAKDFETYNRTWRQVLQENEDLRGSDYGDGKALEQGKVLELGYVMGFNEDIKRLNKLGL